MRQTSRCCRLALSAAAITLAGCAAPLDKPLAGYTCCNLRAADGWISSNNVQGGALIPLGEPVTLGSIKRSYYVYGEVGGREFGFRDDSASTEEQTLRWVRRIVVADDPRKQLEKLPADVRKAIGAARVVVGMTRAEVAMALGFPSPTDTPDTAAPTWRYWTAHPDEPVDLRFDADGKLAEVSGKPAAVRQIEL